jgi:hypothetical protein
LSFEAKETSVQDSAPFELYLFQTQDSTHRVTSYERDYVYAGGTYLHIDISRSEITNDQEQRSGSVKVQISSTHPIVQPFVAYLPSTPLFLTIFRLQEGEADGEAKVIFSGRVNICTFGDPCELTCVPDSDQLKRIVPGTQFQSQCNHILYDEGCTVDPEDFRRSIVLSAVSDDKVTLTSADFAGEADGWFTNGYIELGEQRRMIINHVGDTVILFAGMADLAAGLTIDAFAGCNRKYNGDCVSKFANGVNFWGFEWIPVQNPFGTSIT